MCFAADVKISTGSIKITRHADRGWCACALVVGHVVTDMKWQTFAGKTKVSPQ